MVNAVKLLGFTTDKHFTMACHIDNVVTKCNGLLGVLRRAGKTLPRDLLNLTYKSIVRTQLEYCSAVFANAAECHLKKLDIIQKKAARIITNTKQMEHSAPLLKLLNLDSLASRRSDHIESIVRKVLIGEAPQTLIDLFDDDNNKPTTSKQMTSRLETKRFSNYGRKFVDKVKAQILL